MPAPSQTSHGITAGSARDRVSENSPLRSITTTKPPLTPQMSRELPRSPCRPTQLRVRILFGPGVIAMTSA